MTSAWRVRLQDDPSLRDTSTWPQVDYLAVTPDQKRILSRNLIMVTKALEGQTLRSIEREYKMASGRLSHLLNRCLGGQLQDPPALMLGLIPGTHLRQGQRRTPLGTISKQTGDACAFRHLLKSVPGLVDHLDRIIKGHLTRSRCGINLKVKDFHAGLLAYLHAASWPNTVYPLNRPSKGYYAARNYLIKRIPTLLDQAQPQPLTLPVARPVAVMEEIEIDEHRVDAESALQLKLSDTWEPLRVSRFTLLAARDVGTTCALAFHLCLSPAADKGDLLALFNKMMHPWRIQPFTTPGIEQDLDGVIPKEIASLYQRASIGIIRLDNALIHLAERVQHYICNTHCATLNLGVPGTPLARQLIETAFREMNITVHSLPSSSGKNPVDPRKEARKNRKSAPEVSVQTLEEIIQAHMLASNASKRGCLGGQTPIEALVYGLRHGWIPLHSPDVVSKRDPLQFEEWVSVHNDHHDTYCPYVVFMRTKYRNPGVIPRTLVGTKVRIVYQYDEIRTLRVYAKSGKYLGELFAPKSWQRFPHGVRTKKTINKLIDKGGVTRKNPCAGYLNFVLAKRKSPTYTLELVRIAREFELDHYVRDKHHRKPRLKRESRPLPRPRLNPKSQNNGDVRIPDWFLGLQKEEK